MTTSLDTSTTENKTGSGFKRFVIVTLGILLLAAVGSGIGLFYYVDDQLQPVESTGDLVKVTIPKGASAQKIGVILEDSGLIRNAQLFKWYVRWKETGGHFQAGNYEISAGSTIDEIIAKLENGEVVRDTVTFTIPEGWNIDQIATRLAEQGLVNKELFLKEINEGQFEYDWIAQIPEHPGRKYRLEGFLFPETYEVEKGSSEREIIDRMLAQFDKEWKTEWREHLKQQGFSFYDAVILASIVEREVVADFERPIVAGIFYNRLADGWLLQSCATVQYILGKQRDRITYKDLEIESPYNTYLHEGLPPGPIASPGRTSLEAVVYPEDTEFFFFVTKKDGSQEHLFARTFAEHKKNNAKSQGSW